MNTDPTVSELAALAATLNAAGRMTPDAAAEAALAHWRAANVLLYTEAARAEAQTKEREATAAAEADLRDALAAVRKPERFPVPLDAALPCWLPKLKGRTGEAAALYRAYLADSLTATKYRGLKAATKDEVAQQYARDRQWPFNEQQFGMVGSLFLQWYTRRHAAEVAAARAAAGRRGGRPRKKAKARTSGNQKKL